MEIMHTSSNGVEEGHTRSSSERHKSHQEDQKKMDYIFFGDEEDFKRK